METGCGQKQPQALTSNGLAQTPPMGWNSWNTFQDRLSDILIQQDADAMVTNGMRDAGYQYINLDDGWALPDRVNGHIQADPLKFPQGIKAVADYLHARGFKFGIYADRGAKTCLGKCPGSYGHETTDAVDFASWGVDYIKYDNCHAGFLSNQEADYQRMGNAIAATGRPMVYSICAWEFKNWMPSLGNLWRTTWDITNQWGSVISIIDLNEPLAPYAGPGHWNDPDMLVVGCSYTPNLQAGRVFDLVSELVGGEGLSDNECQAHFSLWAMMAAPLIAGNDVRTMPDSIRKILLNKEVIAVDQDPLGKQCVEAWKDLTGLYVYSKELRGKNTRAVALMNRTVNQEVITVQWKDIGLPEGKAKVRDLWKHADVGVYTNNYTSPVPPHGVVLLLVTAN
jgi:alpha-galactosidase